jgi:hypothetical protein
VSEFLNRGISLGISPTIFVEDLLGHAGDLESLIFTGNVSTVFNFIT